ncbi:unnamed protein product [Blepharisma stoltei]|uniref:Tyrosine specific protein phosphatases domain-containing protein n=1 Tax=Blepharisma stoltei TaxID=1481888 RepID=A0AAU9ILB1_9CILI|nr:unnamed protein product [Blepharisma stoltei]
MVSMSASFILKPRPKLEVKRSKSMTNLSKTSWNPNPSTLSIIYQHWQKLPTASKLEYTNLKKIFTEESQKIRQEIRRNDRLNKSISVIPRTKYKRRVRNSSQVVDLMEKLKKARELKEKEKQKKAATPLLHFAKALGQSCQSCTQNVLFSSSRSSKKFGFLLKKSIIERTIAPDEPYKEILEAEKGAFSRIPIKEELTIASRTGELFISDLNSASTASLLKRHDIRSILSIGINNQPVKYPFIENYYTVNIVDNDSGVENFFESIPSAFKIIDKCLSEGNLLIHCYYGVSRSCAVVAVYLIKKYQISLAKAITITHKGRKSFKLSPLLEKMLLELEKL